MFRVYTRDSARKRAMIRHPAGKARRWAADGGNGYVVDDLGMKFDEQPRIYVDAFIETAPDVEVKPHGLLLRFDTIALHVTAEASVLMAKRLAEALQENR